jgi:phosphotransferase system enzyme I (PtsI)
MIEEISTPLAMFIVNTMLARQDLFEKDMFSLRQTRQKQVMQNRPMRGTPITAGVAFGKVMTISGIEELLALKRIPQPINTAPEAIKAEKELYQAAVDAARKACQKTARELEQTLSESDCNIFSIHAMLLDDPTLQKTIMKKLNEGHSLNVALATALKAFTAQYRKIEDEYLRERIFDIKDVILNLKNAADNIRGTSSAEQPRQQPLEAKRIIVVAKELLPSQLVALPLRNVTGIVCEDGGRTSHVAILARALQKTMLVGVKGISEYVTPGDGILLDGNAGSCFLNPPFEMLRQYSESIKTTMERSKSLNSKDDVPPVDCTMKDGERIHFGGNVALLSELPAITHYGLSAVGLYRTEFMFMIRSKLPTEEEQFNILKRLVTTANVPVTIRLLDAGGDKQLPYLKCWDMEENPMLGWRGLRFLLSNQEIMRTQLRAILRTTAFGKVNILIPMVADLFDLMEAKRAIKAAEESLEQEGIPFSRNYKVGIMIEIPSAIRALPEMLSHIDYVSIGTNDLVQFLFAVDRGNQSVHQWYRQCHPVILRIVRDVCKMVAAYPSKFVGLCGELAGSRRAIPLLIGAGVRYFSMTPSRVPIQRENVSSWTVDECRKLLDKVLEKCHSEMDVRQYMDKTINKHGEL